MNFDLREFAPSFDKVGKAWSGLSPKSTRDAHFFGTLDFDNGQTVFQAVSNILFPHWDWDVSTDRWM